MGPATFVTWGVGVGQPASSSVSGQTSGPTLTAHPVFCHQALIGHERFDLPPAPFANANIGAISEALQAMELRWVTAMQPSSRGTARLSSEMSASLPAWMTPSQTPRLHWSDRQQQRQEQHQQQTQQQPAPQLPLDRSATDDTIDVLEACGCSLPPLASYDRVSACLLSCQLAGGRYTI